MTYSLEKINAHFKAAEAYAELSKAKRLKVGAIIVRDDRIISVGYNGTPSGFDNNCEDDIGGNLVSKKEVCHAEMNAIMFAAKNGVSTNDCSIYTTHAPCYECAKMIIQCGISNVIYKNEYRDDTGIKMIKKAGINLKSYVHLLNSMVL